jgi:hypothetical protein
MLELSLALLISALAAVGVQREIVRTQVLRSADIEADNLKLYRQALQDYTDQFYDELQRNLAVTRNGVNLAAGAADGQSMQPTVANLIAMGFLPAGFTNSSLLTDTGVFRNLIQRIPVGCAPANTCDITGLAYVDQPFVVRSSGGNTNAVVIGQMLSRIGGLAGTSMETSTATITGSGAGWAANNPATGAPAGIVGARFGVGTSVFNAYVRRNDTRDPNLLGPLTVAGATQLGANLGVTGNATITGTLTANGATTLGSTLNVAGASTFAEVSATGQVSSTADIGSSNVAGCLRAALSAGGNLASRAADCVTRVLMSNAGVTVSNALGTARINLDGDTGVLRVNSGAGAELITADGGTGRIQAQTLRATLEATRGTACTTNGDVASDTAASGSVLVCRSLVWRSAGLDQQTAGSACVTNGQLAVASTGEALICRSAVWVLLDNRVTRLVPMELFSGNGPATVEAPICGTDGTMQIVVSGLQGGSDYGGLPPRNRFEFRVAGAGPWNIDPVMTDSSGSGSDTSFSGSAYNLGWTATTYCRYSGG